MDAAEDAASGARPGSPTRDLRRVGTHEPRRRSGQGRTRTPTFQPLPSFADDHDDMREAVVGSLRAAGHRTMEARDGEELLELLRNAGEDPLLRPDVVVTDVRMPKLSGLGVLSAGPPSTNRLKHPGSPDDGGRGDNSACRQSPSGSARDRRFAVSLRLWTTGFVNGRNCSPPRPCS